MKRKITELEKKLLNNGWKLSTKHYEGKHSERTWFYEYTKYMNYEGELFGVKVIIDPKRNHIIDYGIENLIKDYASVLCFNSECLQDLTNKFKALENSINHLLNKDLDEQLEIAEILEIENQD